MRLKKALILDTNDVGFGDTKAAVLVDEHRILARHLFITYNT